MEDYSQDNKQKFSVDWLLQMCGQMGSLLDADKLTSYFVSEVSEIFEAGRVSFMLLDESTKELSIKAYQGLSPEVLKAKVKLGELFSGWVAQEGKSLLVRDIEEEYPDLPRSRLSRYQTKSFVIVPVKIRDKIFGVLSLTDKKESGLFSEEEMKWLNLLADYFGLHIENNRLRQKNKDIAIFDPLTNLFNHRYFQEQLQEEIYRAERYRRPLSLIMLDIDKFSEYNQAHGYSSGDSVLVQMAQLIRESVRQIDLVSRFGLDEFTIILPETKAKEAIFVGEKIREKISQAVFTEDETRKSPLGMSRLTVSVGITEHRLGLTKEEVVRQCSAALLDALQRGRNCVCVFKQ